MIPTVINLGPVTLHLYGLIIGLGLTTAVSVSHRFARRFDLADEVFWSATIWTIGAGIIGARLYHVIDYWQEYRRELSLIPQLWTGGLGIYGAILGGFIGLWLFSLIKSRTLSSKPSKLLLSLLDASALGLPLGQAIGRLGNFVNQELYGYPTTLPWGIIIDRDHRLPGYEAFNRFHPLFAYEALVNLVIFCLLIVIYRSNRLSPCRGYYFASFILMYSLGRFFLESLKIDPWRLGNIPVAQLISFLLISISLSYLGLNRKKLFTKP
ncbi:prolipoprotein diacylglyceryl transferase [Microgenomates group bacterium RIFCSPLOWO2_01_FULL_46_13]|nr:MAG: prolipoprotein diacylglyceryl transferase [Microgenomates group bacterium RIFCSPHIGHO2_01_FULL_45_11]OGV95017.1 MAG: prolipoprotein diacylglyceryl transferase [Microgenomates group bacterium RIFCSPLOWO2_01_FULL_46_13]